MMSKTKRVLAGSDPQTVTNSTYRGFTIRTAEHWMTRWHDVSIIDSTGRLRGEESVKGAEGHSELIRQIKERITSGFYGDVEKTGKFAKAQKKLVGWFTES